MANDYQGRSERQQRNNELISIITVAALVLFAFVVFIIKLAQLFES